MKLTDLKPRWIHPNVFVFLCPHCQEILLSCKNIQMSKHDQYLLFHDKLAIEEWDHKIVSSKPDQAWKIEGDFLNMTVTPSIDASASGHWHGHIQNGNIT